MGLERLIAPFGTTIVERQVGYCNRNVIPLLIERRIEWKMTPFKIEFCGRVFPMKYIDNGEAEEFIISLVDDLNGQSSLDIWRK